MGLKSFAENGCGLTDSLATLYKLKLAKDELEQNAGLRDAQAAYYNAQADYLGRSKGKNTGGSGGSGSVPVQYVVQPDGTVLAVPKKMTPGGTITATHVEGVQPGSTQLGGTKPAEPPLKPQGPVDVLKKKLTDFLGGTPAPPSSLSPAAPAATVVPVFVRGPDGKLYRQ